MMVVDNENKRFECPCCGENLIESRVVRLHRAIERVVGLHRGLEYLHLHVTSGYRCEKHNREEGGSETSSHLKGLAWDVACDRSRTRYRIVGAAIGLGITRIGVGKDFVHLDIDGRKAPRVIWMYG